MFKLLWNRTLKLWCMLSVSSAGERSNLDSFYGIIFGWIRPPVWLAARTRRQVCQHNPVAGAGMSISGKGMAGRVDLSCVTAAHRDLESVCGAAKCAGSPQEWAGAHEKEQWGSPWVHLLWCCWCPACLPGLGLLSALLLPREF